MNWTEQNLREYAQRRLKDESRARERMQNANANPMVGIPSAECEPTPRPPLVKKAGRKNRVVHRVKVRISIISVRRRLLDSDNLVAGAKQLRDVLAELLGCTDAEGSGIEWEYSQTLTRGRPGTIVKIEHV